MVGKSYLRFEEGYSAGVIVSPQSLTVACGHTDAQKTAPTVFLPSLESVHVLNLKTGVTLHRLTPATLKASKTSEVTAVVVAPLRTRQASSGAASAAGQLAMDWSAGWSCMVGYASGHVALFTSDVAVLRGAPSCRFYALGHRPETNVLALSMSRTGEWMASGGQDTDITLWDVATQDSAFRLRGHRGGVVGLQFASTAEHSFVISGSADGLVKIWDLNVRQCLQTIVASDTQVTSLLVDPLGSRLFVGLRENFLKVYDMSKLMEGTINGDLTQVLDHGTIARKINKPVTSLSFSHDGAYLLIVTSKSIEVFRMLSVEDIKKKVSRRQKRKRTAANGVEEDEDAAGGVDAAAGADAANPNLTAAEEVRHLRTFFFDDKVRSAVFVPPTKQGATITPKDTLHLLLTFANNSVISYTTTLTESQLEGTAVLTLTDLAQRFSHQHAGHRSDIRKVHFTDDDSALLTMSQDSLKLWSVTVKSDLEETDEMFFNQKESNVASHARSQLVCTGSVTFPEATCSASAVASSSDLVCVGFQDGSVSLVNVGSGELYATQPAAHIGAVKHLTSRPDDSGFTSVGEDRRLVLWTFVMTGKEPQQTVTLQMTQEVELNELPLFVSYSPDGKLFGVGLQDHNIQLFYGDTMKPFLVLFGHKLPPTDLAFSTDGTLAASVGMDKSLRFWGTDFGDCHRAIHCHDEYVTSVSFVPNTHYVVTTSMDGTLKYWDGDNWTLIQAFRQHPRGIWSGCVNTNGTVFASAGVDRCARLLLRTDEILFPQEEEERVAQEAMDEAQARKTALNALEEKAAEVGTAGQPTSSTINAAENLMEALDLVSVEIQRKQAEAETEVYTPHILMRNKTPMEYLWSVIETIRPSEIRHAVSALTSTHMTALLQFMEQMLDEKVVLNYESAAQIVLCLVSPAPGKSTGRAFLSVSGEGEGARRSMKRIRVMLAEGLDAVANRMDYNVAGLSFLMHRMQEKNKDKFFDLSKVQGYKKKYHSRAN